MVATKKPKKKPTMGPVDISEAYKEYVLKHGRPSSVFVFCDQIGIHEKDFYKHFGSFDGIEKSIWLDYITETKEGLESDKAYSKFSVREKMLAFYFGLAEVLKNNRSFVLHQLNSNEKQIPIPLFLRGFNLSFDDWVKSLLAEGVASGEIAKRPFINDRYHLLFWVHLMFILQFWRKDDSADFERTDAAIEKSVNLAFDLINKGILDNAIDFGKFLYQTVKD